MRKIRQERRRRKKNLGEAAQYAIKMHHVTKTFGKVVANKNVDLELKTGEILRFSVKTEVEKQH